MADRPIIFSGPMVQALLAARKSQTRRLLKKPAAMDALSVFGPAFLTLPGNVDLVGYAPGDRLYVREAHSLHRAHGQDFKPGGFDHGKRWGPWSGLPIAVSPDKTQVAYFREGFDRSGPPKWRPSIHMPRWASRITLTVIEVRVQRLQEISKADAVAEGVTRCAWAEAMAGDGRTEWHVPAAEPGGFGLTNAHPTPIGPFAELWDSLHGPDAWDANPWVVALTFTVHKGNIDEGQP